MQRRAPGLYEDEVDIHLNPKIGADWQLRGHQKRIVTLGRMRNIIWPGAAQRYRKSQLCGRQQQKFIFIYQSVKTSESDIPASENNHAHRG